MNILHINSLQHWVMRLLIRQGGTERRSHIEGGRKRDMLSQANQHLLRDVGMSNPMEERPNDGRR